MSSIQPQHEHQNNHKKICRICLKEGNLKAINEKYENASISEMLQTCFSIQVQENDGLPQNICLICVSELVQAYNLSKKFQTSKIALNEQKPLPVTLIKTVEPNTNDDEFVLPDKSIDRKDIETGDKTEFILIDKNIIRKIKDHRGHLEIPSPSEELKQAKLRIINAKSNVVEEIITTKTPVYNKKPKNNSSPESILKKTLLNKTTPNNIYSQTGEKNKKESPGKINILSIKQYNKDLNSIRGDKNENSTNLQLDSIITNKKTENKNEIKETNLEKEKQQSNNNITEVKSKETNPGRLNKTKWNTRNKIYKNHKNKKIKKKIRKDLLYSSAKYHEQFEKFLSVANTTNDEEEIEKIPVEESTDKKELKAKEENSEPQQSTSSYTNNHLKTREIKNKLVSGYVKRFENKKECPICKKSFKYLEPHLRIHSHKKLAALKQINDLGNKEEKEDMFNCKYCDRQYYDKNKLLNHEKNHQNVKKYSCSLCEKSFNKMTALQHHYNIHTKKNLYECDICKKCSYNIKSNLYRHQRVCSIKNGKRFNREI